MKYEKIAFVTSTREAAQAALKRLEKIYGNYSVEESDVIVALGGDGFMLRTLHQGLKSSKPVYGMNYGSIGFLMNDSNDEQLLERINKAESSFIHPLKMCATDMNGNEHTAFGINDVSVMRRSYLAAKVRIHIDGKVRMEELICDGVLVSTPAGSTAYNFSVHGPILPMNAPLMALTPISPFRPRRWRGALLSHDSKVRFEILDPDKRPVAAEVDSADFNNVVNLDIETDLSKKLHLLFDDSHGHEERILREQFEF